MVMPKGWGELPAPPESGFRMPTEKEWREGFGPNFDPAPTAPAERFDDGAKDGTGEKR